MASTITVQNLIDWARTHIKLAPIIGVGGFTNEPALQIANDTLQKIIAYPYKWKWNRASATSFVTVDGTAEYTITNASDEFAFIDRAYQEDNASAQTPKPFDPLEVVFEIQKTDVKQSPMTRICVDRWTGASNKDVVIRFDTIPDATIRRVYVDYQKKPTILTALANTFAPIPDDMGSVLRQIFLASGLRYVDDPRWDKEMRRADDMIFKYHQFYGSEQPYNPHFVPTYSIFAG